MGRGYCILGVWLYCSGGRGYWYWGVASKHCGPGLAMEAWLLCIGAQVCGSRGVAKMHCGRGLAMDMVIVYWGCDFIAVGAGLCCIGGVA